MTVPPGGPNALQYRRLIESAPFAVWVLDAEGRVREINAVGARILDRAPGQILGRPFTRLVVPDEQARAENALEGLLTGQTTTLHMELAVHRPRGERRRMAVTATAIVEEDGRVSGVHGLSRDVTDDRVPATEDGRKLEARLQQAQKMEAVGRLAGGVAHDFNNILSVIGGTVELLLQDMPRSDPRRPDLLDVQRAVEQGSALNRQLLAFSRQQVLEPVVLDLNAIVEHTGRILRRLLGEDIELAQRLDPGIGRVKADPGQIEQILLNLALNARDAMPRGGTIIFITRDVEIDAREAAQYEYPVEPGPYVMLSVSDTGVGMSRDVQDRVFEPFFTTKAKARGTGLGLSTVYGIVKQSGGYIWVDSEPGGGTTFRICLPRVAEPARAQKKPDPHRSRADVPMPTPRGSVLVLLVEDDAAVRRVAKRMLERSGYRVLEAEDGVAALSHIENTAGEIDLLLTDVVMPRMSGPELAARARAVQPRMKVLFTSGYTETEIERHQVREDGAAFLQKPYTVAGLASKVAEVLVGG